jgi:GH35 family endo-1,4-beta-xylanase
MQFCENEIDYFNRQIHKMQFDFVRYLPELKQEIIEKIESAINFEEMNHIIDYYHSKKSNIGLAFHDEIWFQQYMIERFKSFYQFLFYANQNYENFKFELSY